MLRPKYRTVYQFVVGVWLTLSIASVLLAAVSWTRLSESIASGRQWGAVGPQVDEILKTMLDSETGVRGFVITGNTNYLAPYDAAQADINLEFDNLTDLTAANTNMLQTVVNLRAQTAALHDFNAQFIAARKQSFAKAQNLMALGAGTQIMHQVRAQVTALNKIYYHQFLDVREEISAQFARAILTSLVAGIVGIVAGIWAFWLARLALKHQVRERQLVEAKLQAERSSHEKSAFLANMSHEIRTPLNAVLGFSELLQDELREPKHRQYVQSIRSSAASLLQLINDILDMSKIEAGVMELRPEPTDSREVCDFIRTLFAEPALKKGIQFKCQIAEDLPRALLIDRVRLRQILVNLVGNAIKFTDHGQVEVRVSSQTQPGTSRVTLAIDVVDTGVGIPPDRLDAIFQPFVQAGAHHEKEIQGTGLGLSIVKRLAEMMGGAVTVTSALSEGSVFSLRFPNVPISARRPASEKILREQMADFNQLRPATLLVADDNQPNREYISGIFQNTHHRLIFCASGEEAIAKARENNPDIILLDLRMPGLSGQEALAQIRKIPGMELVPAIAVTGSLNTDDSFSACVRKPFSTGDLFERLAEFLPRHTPADPPARPETLVLEDTAAQAPVELLALLRQLLAEPWPALRESMAVNEIRAFARQLEILAKHWHFKSLLIYAGQLLRDAETYSVIDLERHLGEFPARVEQFAQNKENKENIMTDERHETRAPSAAETASAAAPLK